MTETNYQKAKTIHEQLENITAFVNHSKESENIQLVCGEDRVIINTKSKVCQTVVDFLEQAILQLDEQFKQL